MATHIPNHKTSPSVVMVIVAALLMGLAAAEGAAAEVRPVAGQQGPVRAIQKLRVSGRVESPCAVQPGDSMGAIAGRAGVSLGQLLAWNPAVTNPDVLVVGQLINRLQPASPHRCSTPSTSSSGATPC